jgi:hypothetical protein
MRTSLHDEQQHMLRLLKDRACNSEDDGELVSKLEFQRTIIVWWRCFQFEHWLILTSRLLKDQKLLNNLVLDLYRNTSIPAYPNEAGDQFVQYLLSQNIHPTIKSVASLELAMIKLKDEANQETYCILWNQEPLTLLDALVHARPYDLEYAAVTPQYEMIVSHATPGGMIVRELNRAGARTGNHLHDQPGKLKQS